MKAIGAGVFAIVLAGSGGLNGARPIQTPAVGAGQLVVSVENAGAPVAGATVCVGTSQDLNLYAQGRSDGQGRIPVRPMPPVPFVVTAHAGTLAVQVARGASAPDVGLLLLTATLGRRSAARCPVATPPGPVRSLVTEFEYTPSPIGEARTSALARAEFCFGAVGRACGAAPAGLPPSAACAGGYCAVNGGSWEHDTCCHANPNGYACSFSPGDVVGAIAGRVSQCRESWDKAVRLTTKGLNWTRQVDFFRANATGTVEHSQYCAPRDTLVPPADAPKCCARDTRALSTAETALASATGESLRACR
jgi:hypothetical protein